MEGNSTNNQDFDDLKSLWQSQEVEKTYDTDEIFKMIHRKSVNSVQWLFIITLIEVLIGIGLSVWTFISGKNLYINENMKVASEEMLTKYENFSHLGLVGSFVIFGITYFYYKKISSSLSVSELMQSIMKFRKIVVGFIIAWVSITQILFIPYMMELGAQTYLQTPKAGHLPENDAVNMAKKVGLIVTIVTAVVILLFSAVYYGIIYGVFLRRLGKNLKELKSIE